MKARALFVAVVFCCLTAPAQTVTKIDPPNWWLGLPNPMLLVSGDHLERATTNYPGVTVERSQPSADGHYLFVWLKVASSARPGEVPLQIGATRKNWKLAQRTPTAGRFQGFDSNDVIYLIMPDRFADGDPANDEPAPQLHTFDRAKPKAWHGGDLRGIQEHLPYLHALGVTTLWLTPIWQNDWRVPDFSYHGYHVTDFYSVDRHFGTMDEARALVTAAHAQGMKVVFDYVANHTGPNHPWAADPPTPTWLHGTPQHHLEPEYEFAPIVDPHAPPRMSRHTLEGWFAQILPDLNPDDPLLAQYLFQNAVWWAESTGIDGFRLDTFPYSSRAFWSGWDSRLLRLYPKMKMVGEVFADDVTITSAFAGGHKVNGIDTDLPTVFDFPLMNAIREAMLDNSSLQRLVSVLQRDYLYPDASQLVTFVGNHDMRRAATWASTPAAMAAPHGPAEQTSPLAKLKAAYALLLTIRGIPQLYYGDELALPGADDPDNRHDFPGGFPGDPRNAFTEAGRTPEENAIFDYVQSLLQLRARRASLRTGSHTHIDLGEHWYAFLRQAAREKTLIVFNSSARPQELSIRLEDTPLAAATTLTPLLNSPSATISNQLVTLSVPAMSVAIYNVE